MKAKKGWLAVRVGVEDGEDGSGGFQRFMIPISYLYHPQFRRLLEDAHETYGYQSAGPLKLPCSIDDFVHIRWLIERESHNSFSYGQGHNHQRHLHGSSFSFQSC